MPRSDGPHSPVPGRIRARALALAVLLLGAPLAHAGSLRFFGTGAGDVDRVKIALDAPARPVDVGGAFTVEFWCRALPGGNPAGPCTSGNDNWITGHVLVDRDVYGPGDAGDYGLSLFADGIAFGVAVGSSGAGICGGGALDDGAWHHVAAVRESDGRLSLFADGALAARASGPTGDVGYRDGRTTAWPASDPYLVLGAEKHDAGAAYPSFAGWLDELRVSSVARYVAPFARPTQPFAPDAATAALFHFDEGVGDTLHDASLAAGGPSHGHVRRGGPSDGPRWSSDGAPFGPLAADRADRTDLALRVTPSPAVDRADVRFTLRARGAVRASVHAADGRLVRTLARGTFAAGPHRIAWDLRDAYGRPTPPGWYAVRLETPSGVRRAGMVVVR